MPDAPERICVPPYYTDQFARIGRVSPMDTEYVLASVADQDRRKLERLAEAGKAILVHYSERTLLELRAALASSAGEGE